MAGVDPDFVLRYLAEVEALAEEVMAARQQTKPRFASGVYQELLEEDIAKLQKELKVKVSNLMEAQASQMPPDLTREDLLDPLRI
ncbi:hypothetical protein E2320_009355 [Naja naja]|nr:hypothetical protein E2320_009355 [Naja naja]